MIMPLGDDDSRLTRTPFVTFVAGLALVFVFRNRERERAIEAP